MLSVKLCGPAHGKDSVELVPDWSKADMAKLRERLSRVNWGEEGQDLGAEAEWERFKEILDREVVMCVPVKRRRKGSKPWWMTSYEDDQEEEKNVEVLYFRPKVQA